MKIYYTSYYQPGAIYLRFEGYELIFESVYLPAHSKTLLFEVHSLDNEDCVFSKVIKIIKGNRIQFHVPKQGIFFIQLYFEKGTNNFYNGVIFKRDIPFYHNGNSYCFINTVTYKDNIKFIKSLQLQDTPRITISLDILKLVQSITMDVSTRYEKILRVHDWIATNIYYDIDSLNDGSYKSADYSFDSIIKSRKSVCQGYANINAILLNSIGIPTLIIECFALGISTDGGWEREFNLFQDPNHVISASFDGNRWILSDLTWDSPNKFWGGKFITEGKLSHKYFDLTPNFLSNTHRLTSIQTNL